MNEEINKIINNLEGCIGMFDAMKEQSRLNTLKEVLSELEEEEYD